MNKSVPKLRFNEFEGNWNRFKIESISELVTSGSRDWSKFYSETGHKFIRMTNLPRDGIHLLLNNLKYVTLPEKNTDGLRTSLYHEDILVSITAELGKIGWVPDNLGKAFINQHTALIRPNTKKVNSKFISYKLSSKRMNKTINRLNDAGAKAGLNLSTLKSLPVDAPELKEQQKIADFLSSIDNKIRLLTEKQTLLQQYKKGVMQKLFPSTGSGQVPELRFASTSSAQVASTSESKSKVAEPVEAYPDWEDRQLGDCLTIGSGKDYKHLKHGDIPVYGTGGHMLDVDDFLYEGDSVCIGRKGTIDKPMFLSGKFWTVDTLFYTHSYKNNLPKFIYYIFLQINWKKYNEASGVPSLSKKTIEKIKVKIPSSIEQQKIANFLSEIDKKIEAVTKQIEHTQTFKKGLLQKMFV